MARRATPPALATTILLLICGCDFGTDADAQGTQACEDVRVDCGIGGKFTLESDAEGNCKADGKYVPTSNEVAIGGACGSKGNCAYACTYDLQTVKELCNCGLKRYSIADGIECQPCDSSNPDTDAPEDETELDAPTSDSDEDPPNDDPTDGDVGSEDSDTDLETTSDTTSDAEQDAPAPDGGDASTVDAGAADQDDEEAAECAILALSGQHVVTSDGLVFYSPNAAPIIDDTTSTPLTGAIDVSETQLSACAVLQDGGVACWRQNSGGNANGQLGDGTQDSAGATFRATRVLTAPEQPLENAVALARTADPPGSASTGYGSLGMCAVTEEGDLYCWGNLVNIVGGGTAVASAYAQAITTNGLDALTHVKQVALSRGGACVVREGDERNEVWCWGLLGALTEGGQDSAYPTFVAGLDDPSHPALSTTFSTGGGYTMCVVDAGNVRCWGYAPFSGSGSFSGTLSTPTLVKMEDGETPLSGIVDLAGGDSYFCARHESGSRFCWQNSDYAKKTGATGVTALGNAYTYAAYDQRWNNAGTSSEVSCGPI